MSSFVAYLGAAILLIAFVIVAFITIGDLATSVGRALEAIH